MTWALLPAIAAYLLVAWLVHNFGLSLAGTSPVGRSAAPVIAALWLPAVCFLVVIALVAVVEATFDNAADWLRSPEDRA